MRDGEPLDLESFLAPLRRTAEPARLCGCGGIVSAPLERRPGEKGGVSGRPAASLGRDDKSIENLHNFAQFCEFFRARSRLYRNRFLRINNHFATFFMLSSPRFAHVCITQIFAALFRHAGRLLLLFLRRICGLESCFAELLNHI